jgi:hypothetical protein
MVGEHFFDPFDYTARIFSIDRGRTLHVICKNSPTIGKNVEHTIAHAPSSVADMCTAPSK